MEGRIPARLTASEGRKFGVTVGLALVVLGLLLIWRGRPGRGDVLLILGGALLAAGVAIPTRLGPLERAWMGLAHLLSKVTTPIFMGVVYFALLTPTGLLRRLGGHSMLVRRESKATGWEPHRQPDAPRDQMERQF